MKTRKPIAEASRQLDEDLDGITGTATATEKELEHPWIPQSQAQAEKEAARAKPKDTAAQAAQIARISAILEKR
jgi:hypothetical protein